jgi:hypothetical protein
MMYLLQTWISSRKPDSGARLITDYALEMVPYFGDHRETIFFAAQIYRPGVADASRGA